MSLGNKVSNLRKNKGILQEQLAEILGVTRQTISKWELEETTPDINQAKEISKFFNVSLDELTDNDVKNLLIERLNNTEQSAGIAIKILKFVEISFLILLIIDIITFIIFAIINL